MATGRHATPFVNHNLFIFVVVLLSLPMVGRGAAKVYDDGRNYLNDDGGRRLTREYHLRQGALRGLIVKPSRQYDRMQLVEMFLGIPYAAPPTGNFRFMPPASAPPWSGVRMATHFAPVCPQALPSIKKENPPSMGRQKYLTRIKPFLSNESEDCLYLNIYVPYREQKSKKFPVLVFIHGDSFEWGSGNPYDGRILASYGNIMVITINYRLGILGFLKPSLTEHDYGNNGLLDQLAALQWIKDNIEDLNGDPNSVTLMGHGTGAACINYLMLSHISNGLFHRAILMSGSALSDWAMTANPTVYTLQVAQSLNCSVNSKNMMSCLQRKQLSEIKKVQVLAREFETPLGPIVAGSFIPTEPSITMESFPNLLSQYQLLSGVTELESYHDFGVIELDLGILEKQRDDFIKNYAKIRFDGAENEALIAILKKYSPSKLDPQRWSVKTNTDVILNLFSDARTFAPAIRFANYQSKSNRQSYFYVFGHNSISNDFAALNKSVHGEEVPYVLGVPLGDANTHYHHFHTEYTPHEKLLSEVMMRLWTNFVKIGSPNTQSVNKYYNLDKKQWTQYNVEWPEYDVDTQPYLRLDIPPSISSLYRNNFTKFWIEELPNKLSRFVINPLFDTPTTQRPKPATHKSSFDVVRKMWPPQPAPPPAPSYYNPSSYGRVRPYQPPAKQDIDIYRQIQSIKSPLRPVSSGLMEKTTTPPTTAKPKPDMPVKTSSATITLIISLGVLFLVVDVAICSILYFKKRKLRLREQTLQTSRQSRAEIGEVDLIGQKSKEDKSALQTLKNGCSVIKSMSKKRGSIKKSKKKSESCKTPKSDDSGGFRERFQLRRHLSTSTLDAHTKVRDWIANEVMHRCSPAILRKSNSDLNNDKHMSVVKPFTRSEELLSDTKRLQKDTLKIDDTASKAITSKSYSGKAKTSEKTTSTSALGSHSSISSQKNSLNSIKVASKSSDSLKSKATDSLKSKKVSVAIDATPSARTNSILKQQPIELSKAFESDQIHSNKDTQSQKQNTEATANIDKVTNKIHDNENKTYTNIVTLSVSQEKPLVISHKHSRSDPVSDVNYDKLFKEKMELGIPVIDILPPVTFRNDINVTSREESSLNQPLSAEEALVTIKRRNFPKVLPDLPKAQKRLSLQPTTLQTFRSYSSSTESQSKVPPQPPPRTTTLERRLAYKNTKPLSSFDASNVKKIPEADNKNYENINLLTPDVNLWNRSFDSTARSSDRSDPSIIVTAKDREIPRVIIASGDNLTSEPTIVIKPSKNQVDLPSNVPRVRLPDDFHSHTMGSVTSFSSFCTDDDDEDIEDTFLDDLAEDKLIQELVGGVESPTNMEDVLDSKGPDNSYVKKLEIVPFTINTGNAVPKNIDDYVCVTDLHLPDVSGIEPTAQIKPNFGLNKLQHRTESINRPPEKAVKVKQKKSIKPSILSLKSRTSDKIRSESSKLEHSTSGSSNDTETSTGTVKKVEPKKDNR